MITSVLVANRGEIARRVFRSCRALGVGCVAVHSDADAQSPHVEEADAAVRLPGNSPAETYLRASLIIDAARRAGADAIHPGYGFLSENADFARAVIEAGLTWIGPSPEAIDQMGSKIAAKQLMSAAGVPTLSEVDEVGESDLPVLIKASAGGGGRGMRIVRALADLRSELEAARSEAQSAFGDPTVFCEPYLETGRHIEVQIMADNHGTVWAVGERECSIQRRHQKVIEEAPSPLVERTPGMRAKLFEAARAAASAIDYTGAGTVEFLADDHGRFYFLEMNTRLQVEHPVTECTTGLDLVRLQILVAQGAHLAAVAPHTTDLPARSQTAPTAAFSAPAIPQGDPLNSTLPQGSDNSGSRAAEAQPQQHNSPGAASSAAAIPQGDPLNSTLPEGSDNSGPPAARGHAIEVRLYAEDPAQDWRPQSGVVHRLAVPGVGTEFAVPAGAGLRLDSGVRDGSVVSVFYDPMLAKVISFAPTRDEAALGLAGALARAEIHGLTTNRDLLVRVLRHPEFLAGNTDTAFLDRHGLAVLAEPLADKDAEALSALAAALADAAARRTADVPSGWRNVPSQSQRKVYSTASGEVEVSYRHTRAGLIADAHPGLRSLSAEPGEVVLEVDGVRRAFRVAVYPDVVCVDSSLGPVALTPVPRFTDPSEQTAPGSLLAPMPGTVVRVAVSEGDQVEQGQSLLWLEAMKMEHKIIAPASGTLTSLPVTAGQQVDLGAVLAVVTPPE
ncbi:biotin carboxylase N-terminal domain-containing protein [Kibdelosporangium phytohabitans]|uniref:Acetyl/propionyl-CoA carboxylase subuit alpha n=1 Tax=Kibdelosporangium phytohabitans TaxID=860235 RepID=A0A0N9HP58_9PSEU|nr:biotin carboxylase N-terminal domain-containing protein [Kibdelosporangium phytohabitans]ALG06138.1 acetyl/propionyl-CoA carboxylase subuit alpha [Kibdelosporangium phytohabitans]MBE1465771.1 propionyl-CoA carboxylase alpha chain [Kibdelosporangium phytohabitans]